MNKSLYYRQKYDSICNSQILWAFVWDGNVLLSRIYWRIWPPTTGDSLNRSPRSVAYAVCNVMCRRVRDGSIPIHFVDGVLCLETLEWRAWVWSAKDSGRFREQQNNLFERRKNGEKFSDWNYYKQRKEKLWLFSGKMRVEWGNGWDGLRWKLFKWWTWNITNKAWWEESWIE